MDRPSLEIVRRGAEAPTAEAEQRTARFEPLQRRLAPGGSGAPFVGLDASPAPSVALAVQRFGEAVSAGLHSP